MTKEDEAILLEAKEWSDALIRSCNHNFNRGDQGSAIIERRQAELIRDLLALAQANTGGGKEENQIGGAEREVGQWVYRRIEVLMDAEPDTPEGAELNYLADVVVDVEEYGATGEHPVEAAPPSPPSPSPGHTDLMVSPESINAFMEANPLPSPSPWPSDAQVERALGAWIGPEYRAKFKSVHRKNMRAALLAAGPLTQREAGE